MKHKLSKINQVEEERCDCDVCRGEIVSQSAYQDEATESFLTRTRRILISGEINEPLSTYVCTKIQMMSLSTLPIYIYINSPGGDFSAGYAIVDQMKLAGCPIWTIVRGQASSMGAIITAFGEKGCRFATPNSFMMLHSIVVQGPPDPIRQHMAAMTYLEDDYRRKVLDLAKRLKLTFKQLTEAMEKNQWMLPKQAIKMGLIDGIWTAPMERSLNEGPKK